MTASDLPDEAQEAVTDGPEETSVVPETPSVDAASVDAASVDAAAVVEEAEAAVVEEEAEASPETGADAPEDENPVFDSELLDREEAAAAAAMAGEESGSTTAPDEDEDSEDLDQPSDASLWGDEVDAEGPEPGADSAARPGLEKAPPLAGGLDRLKSVLESLVFVSNKPISDRMLAKVANAQAREVRPLLLQLQREYEGRGIELHLVAGGWQFRSATANAPFVRGLVAPKPVRLSRAQIESLAIVAYRQPITRPEIDEIRGVDSGPALKILAERNLVRVLGRKDEPGRPLLYGTTDHFLEFFGLSSLKDLPTLKEFSELTEESRELFERRMGEPLDLRAVEAQARAAEAAAQESMLAEHDPQQELGLVDDDSAGPPDGVAEEVQSSADFGDDAPVRTVDEPSSEGDEAADDDVPDQAIDSETEEPVSEEPTEMTNERFEQEMDDDVASSVSDELDHVTEAISDDFDDEDFESPRKKSIDEDDEEPEDEDDEYGDEDDEDDEDLDEDDYADEGDEEGDEDDEYGDDFGDEDDEYSDEDDDEEMDDD